MTGDAPDIHTLSGAYALDALDGDEAVAFERHLESCAPCRDEVRSLRETLPALAEDSAEPAPDRLRTDVLAGITSVRPLPPVVRAEDTTAPSTPSADPGTVDDAPADDLAAARDRRPRRTARWLAAAAAVLALVAGGAVLRAVDLGRQLDSASATAAQVSTVLTAPDATTATAPVAVGGRAAVVTSDTLGQAVLVTDGLPPAPAGRTYQVWYLGADGSAASAGFVPDSATGAVLLTGDPRRASGVGITVEPAGGSTQPTTTPVVAVRV
jgi:anti-sigma-K factor RskA